MKKMLSYAFLVIAVFLMMGHMLVPHHHSSNREVQLRAVNSKHTIADLIKITLSEDLGKDHLKNMVKVSTSDHNKPYWISTVAAPMLLLNSQCQRSEPTTSPEKKTDKSDTYLRVPGLRGPPQI
jgi:hypothetical protein